MADDGRYESRFERPSSPPAAPEAAPRYLSLLRRCLTREIFLDEQVVDVLGWPSGGPLGDPATTWDALRRAGLRIVRPLDDPEERVRGEDWPVHAETMIGAARLESLEDLVTRVVADHIPGDLVEAGVWRGGAAILMRATLAAYGDTKRCVWLCDSFQGLPEPDVARYPADDELEIRSPLGRQGFVGNPLAVSADEVRQNFARYDLLDDRVRFLEGWFRDTLPTAPIDRIAVLRVDGDLYESTMDALVHLEHKVVAGGFVIIDDYNGIDACRLAVDAYRTERGIDDTIHEIDWTGAWWQKSGG